MYSLFANQIINILGFTALAFFMGLLATPILTHFLYKHKAWRKDREEKRKVPRLGGILIWFSVLLIFLLFNFKFWLGLLVLLLGALAGLADDLLCIRPWEKENLRIRGLRFFWRAVIIFLIGILTGYLLFSYYDFPFFYLALSPLVMIIIFGGAPLDGLDGLFAGSVAPMFSAFAIIALAQGQREIAIFSAIILGALLAFLYFNIPPARFFMGETGVIALLAVLPVLSFLTNSLLYLPIIAAPLIATALSIFPQIFFFPLF